MESNRLQRLESQIKKDLAQIFQETAQSNFPGTLLTVTRVSVSPDLSIGRVQLSIFPTKEKEAMMEWVESEKTRLKDLLVRKMKGSLRKMPELYYYLDESLDQEAAIDRILKHGGDSPIK